MTGTAVRSPVTSSRKSVYPATRFCTTPSASPAANVHGIDRSRPNTAAVAEANSSTVYAVASSPSIETASTPASPARPEPSIQARAEVAATSMPRSVASRRRSTEARMRRPYGVCRMNAHSPAAVTAEKAERDELVGVQPHAERLETQRRVRADAARQRGGVRAGQPEQVHDEQAERGQRDRQADRADDLRGLPRLGEPAEHGQVQQVTERRGEQGDGDQRGQPGGQPQRPGSAGRTPGPSGSRWRRGRS